LRIGAEGRGRLALRGLQAMLFLFALSIQARAQESQEAGGHDDLGTWKLINTAIFAALLIWFLAKYAPRFFNARSSDIQKAIKDATGLQIEADFRYSEIDRKMATLSEEVQRLREQGNVEMEREHERIQQQTAHELERIEQNAANEIEALRKEAADRVQLHTAQIALGLAEKRLRDRFAQGEPGSLIDDFVRLVERGKN
jgi:F0F1-type ATP synthase membrane subunit b/b'